MSFREDYEAAMLEEQRTKDAVNEARRAHKAARERLAKMHGYAKEFKVNLDGDEPSTAGGDKSAEPAKPDGNAPSDTDSGESSEPGHSGEAVQN